MIIIVSAPIKKIHLNIYMWRCQLQSKYRSTNIYKVKLDILFQKMKLPSVFGQTYNSKSEPQTRIKKLEDDEKINNTSGLQSKTVHIIKGSFITKINRR